MAAADAMTVPGTAVLSFYFFIFQDQYLLQQVAGIAQKNVKADAHTGVGIRTPFLGRLLLTSQT